MGEKTFCVICDKDVEIRKIVTHGHYAGSDEPSSSSTASAASSRRLSAGPVVSGSDSAAPTRFWFFCALSKFSVESLISIVCTSRDINLTTVINYVMF
jgi:hypothetical protein